MIFKPAGNGALQEVHHLLSVLLSGVVKINALVNLFDAHCALMQLVLQYQLLQVIKGLFVDSLLSDLHDCFPEVFGLHPMAILTHLMQDDKLHHEHLLQNGSIHDLFLDGHLHLDSFRVGLRP